jgi:hypothetical protein
MRPTLEDWRDGYCLICGTDNGEDIIFGSGRCKKCKFPLHKDNPVQTAFIKGWQAGEDEKNPYEENRDYGNQWISAWRSGQKAKREYNKDPEGFMGNKVIK